MRRLSAKQQAEIQARFLQKQRYQVAMFVPLAGAALLLGLSSRAGPASDHVVTIALGTVGLILAAVLFSWLNWRCPACGKYLGDSLKPIHARKCPGCGVELGRR